MSRLIDADALMKTLGITDMDCGKCKWGDHGYCTRGSSFTDACTAIEDAPSVEERKNGVWIEENTRPRSGQFYCSVCHRTAYDPQPTRAKGWVKRCRYAFCPNCGARMDGEDNG